MQQKVKFSVWYISWNIAEGLLKFALILRVFESLLCVMRLMFVIEGKNLAKEYTK